jgi:NAD(P)-dependent dehydrogenase (short-subunit alcohol dehydrogenase family)
MLRRRCGRGSSTIIKTVTTSSRRRFFWSIGSDAWQGSGSTILRARSPLGVPWIEPEAIAPAIVFLASDEAYMVSGATYDVTGGDSANYTA